VHQLSGITVYNAMHLHNPKQKVSVTVETVKCSKFGAVAVAGACSSDIPVNK